MLVDFPREGQNTKILKKEIFNRKDNSQFLIFMIIQ